MEDREQDRRVESICNIILDKGETGVSESELLRELQRDFKSLTLRKLKEDLRHETIQSLFRSARSVNGENVWSLGVRDQENLPQERDLQTDAETWSWSSQQAHTQSLGSSLDLMYQTPVKEGSSKYGQGNLFPDQTPIKEVNSTSRLSVFKSFTPSSTTSNAGSSKEKNINQNSNEANSVIKNTQNPIDKPLSMANSEFKNGARSIKDKKTAYTAGPQSLPNELLLGESVSNSYESLGMSNPLNDPTFIINKSSPSRVSLPFGANMSPGRESKISGHSPSASQYGSPHKLDPKSTGLEVQRQGKQTAIRSSDQIEIITEEPVKVVSSSDPNRDVLKKILHFFEENRDKEMQPHLIAQKSNTGKWKKHINRYLYKLKDKGCVELLCEEGNRNPRWKYIKSPTENEITEWAAELPGTAGSKAREISTLPGHSQNNPNCCGGRGDGPSCLHLHQHNQQTNIIIGDRNKVLDHPH